MMKNLLFTSLMSVGFLSMYGQDEYDLRTEIQKLDQQTCVENFIGKVFAGQVADYNDIRGCFGVSCVNDLSDQQLKQIISAAVSVQRTHLPYQDFRFCFDYDYEGMKNITLFLSYLDQHHPLIGIINDLYLRDPISHLMNRLPYLNGNRQKQLGKQLVKEHVEDSIAMLSCYIDSIESKKQFGHSLEGVLDSLVAQPKNLQALKDMKQELDGQYSALSKK